MKRLLVWIMMVSILFCLAGCGKRDTTGKYALNEERNEAVINDAGAASNVMWETPMCFTRSS